MAITLVYVALTEYIALMGETVVQAWRCNACGYVWIKVEGRRPSQCPSRSCRSRLWDGQVAPKMIATPADVLPAIQRTNAMAGHSSQTCRIYGCLLCKQERA